MNISFLGNLCYKDQGCCGTRQSAPFLDQIKAYGSADQNPLTTQNIFRNEEFELDHRYLFNNNDFSKVYFLG